MPVYCLASVLRCLSRQANHMSTSNPNLNLDLSQQEANKQQTNKCAKSLPPMFDWVPWFLTQEEEAKIASDQAGFGVHLRCIHCHINIYRKVFDHYICSFIIIGYHMFQN